MGLSIYNIKKWTKMLTGRSILHVNQGLGQCFSTTGIEGYYNDLTEKVTRVPELLDSNKLPLFPLPDGSEFLFPVGIFQYGLGAWDMYLLTKDPIYRDKFLQCAAWAVENQDTKGRWSTFAPIYPDAPYGAMAQGEGASLLLRAHKLTGESGYMAAAKLAVDFMLKDLKDGGTALHDGTDLVLLEYTHLPAVMNGWIFAWFGLWDWVTATADVGTYQAALQASAESLERMLPSFCCRYWSMYELGGKIASPFYHNLHIAQMQALYKLTGKTIFEQYGQLWQRQQKSLPCRTRAFTRKAWQKIRER